MKKLMMTKYGFIRFPEEDFSDDGNRFTCYRISMNSDSHISKLVADGEAYLSFHVNGKLPYEIYSELPNYKKAAWDYNGVTLSTLTDSDLHELFNSCVAYEQEYRDAESSIVYPTAEELTLKCHRIQAKLLKEMSELESLMGEHAVEAATKFSKWEWTNLQDSLQHMLQDLNKYASEKFVPAILGSAYSFNFLSNKEDTEPTYYYRYIKEMLQKHSII